MNADMLREFLTRRSDERQPVEQSGLVALVEQMMGERQEPLAFPQRVVEQRSATFTKADLLRRTMPSKKKRMR